MILIFPFAGDLQDWINQQVRPGVSRFKFYPSFIEFMLRTWNVRMSGEGGVVVALCSIDELVDTSFSLNLCTSLEILSFVLPFSFFLFLPLSQLYACKCFYPRNSIPKIFVFYHKSGIQVEALEFYAI